MMIAERIPEIKNLTRVEKAALVAELWSEIAGEIELELFPVRADHVKILEESLAFEDFEDRQDGLGTEFFGAVEENLALIRLFPEIAPLYEKRVRRKVVIRYDYGIFYVVEPSRIVVVNLLNLRQDEREIRRRLNL